MVFQQVIASSNDTGENIGEKPTQSRITFSVFIPHRRRDGNEFFIYLPIAANSVNSFFCWDWGLVGFLSGLFGVGGGFLLTPLLIMFGIPPTVAAASDSNQIVAASASGTYAHYRLGNVDFKMGVVLLFGGLFGGAFGVQLVKILSATGNADFVIKITYVAMLGIIGGYMFVESLQSLRKGLVLPQDTLHPSHNTPSLYARMMAACPSNAL